MRLYLSSQNLGDHSKELLALVGDNKNVGYIGNAKDDWSDAEKVAKVAEHQAQFEELGFSFTEVDLRQFFGKQEELAKKLESFGLIWCSGGNTFMLRRSMAASGLDILLKRLLEQDKLVYGGSSAGSIVVTPSLHGVELCDEPEITSSGYSSEVIWEGLGMVPFYLVPHYRSDWFGKESELLRSYYEQHSLKHYCLEDGQVMMINGSSQELLD